MSYSISVAGSYLRLLPTGGGVTSGTCFEIDKQDNSGLDRTVKRFKDEQLGVMVEFSDGSNSFYPWARIDHLHTVSARPGQKK